MVRNDSAAVDTSGLGPSATLKMPGARNEARLHLVDGNGPEAFGVGDSLGRTFEAADLTIALPPGQHTLTVSAVNAVYDCVVGCSLLQVSEEPPANITFVAESGHSYSLKRL